MNDQLNERPRLLLDIDGTVAESMPDWLQLAVQVTNGRVDLRPEDVRHYDMSLNQDRNGEAMTVAEWNKVHRAFLVERAAHVAPVVGAVDAVQRLAEKFDIVFATSRPLSGHGPTIDWLDHYFADLPREVHFVRPGQKHLIGNLFAAVEDDFEQAELFRDDEVKCWVRAQPYNVQALNHPNAYIVRRTHWRDIADDLFDRLAKVEEIWGRLVEDCHVGNALA